MITFNMNHLTEAAKYAGRKPGILFYFWHMKMSLVEAYWLFVWFIGSIIHAFFPFFIDFDLLKARINGLKKLKQCLPNDPRLQKVKFDD